MPAFTFSELKALLSRILTSAGVPAGDADAVAEHLALSDLSGHPSHGTIRMPQYLDFLEKKTLVPGGPFRVEKEFGAVALCSGGWNFGQVAALKAAEAAMAKARRFGLGAASLHESGHVGRLGHYAEVAAAQGMILFVNVNNHGANPVVAPHGGAQGRLCPEALAIGVPRPGKFPLVADLSLTVIPEGKVRVARSEGKKVPEGCILDAGGRPTTNPHDFYGPPRGALLPLGGPVGYKGFGLGMIFDIFAGALSGAGVTLAGRTRTGNAAFILALQIDAFAPKDLFFSEVEALVEAVKGCPRQSGVEEILVPGELEARNQGSDRSRTIQIGEGTWKELVAAAAKVGVQLKN
ncbi:MAG: Ldh family oxidoreductase [Planctomycetes bacterium]|nr:Ldh family oxidoreductase [Planctomycetota bacterium]